jgi:hypothetical protein
MEKLMIWKMIVNAEEARAQEKIAISSVIA